MFNNQIIFNINLFFQRSTAVLKSYDKKRKKIQLNWIKNTRKVDNIIYRVPPKKENIQTNYISIDKKETEEIQTKI